MSDAPVLVAVDGGIAALTLNRPAAGAGISLALIGDIVIAGEAANFTAAYGRIGLSPDGGLSWLLPRVIGMRKAQDIIIANRRVDAAEAETIGMVTRVVGSDELAAEGAKHAASLAAGATGAIGSARAVLLESYAGSLESHLELEARNLSAMGGTADFREGAAAFLERRKPDLREFDDGRCLYRRSCSYRRWPSQGRAGRLAPRRHGWRSAERAGR